MHGFLGIALILLLAWLFSEAKTQVKPIPVLLTLGVQIILALLLLKAPVISDGLKLLRYMVIAIETATRQGTSFVFDFLGGADITFLDDPTSPPYIFAFQTLPQIMVFSVLVALFWHWRILPVITRAFAWVLQRTLGIGGAVGLAASASIFLGMAEAPMTIRAYLGKLTRSEFFTVITCGMSTVAGSIMILYTSFLGPVIADSMQHIITASLLNIIGAILISRIMVPGEEITDTSLSENSLQYESTVEALTRGTSDGIQVVVNVAAMVIVLVSLVALVDYTMSSLIVAGEPLTLARIMGWVFFPLAWAMGVPAVDATAAGSMLGTKLMLNEVLAFLQLNELSPNLQDSTKMIMTYAICGFTNLGSVGILIGSLTVLAPERRADLLQLGPRTLVSGTLVACLTGTIAGLIAYIF